MGFSLAAVSEGSSLVVVLGLLMVAASLGAGHRLSGTCASGVVVLGLLIVVASLGIGHRLSGKCASGVVVLGLWSTGSVVMGRGSSCPMAGLPGPGIEQASPALAGGFFTSEPPGKHHIPC